MQVLYEEVMPISLPNPTQALSVLLADPFYAPQEPPTEIRASQTLPLHTSNPRTELAETMTLPSTIYPVPTKFSEIQQPLDPLDNEGLSALVTGKSAANHPHGPLLSADAPEV